MEQRVGTDIEFLPRLVALGGHVLSDARANEVWIFGVDCLGAAFADGHPRSVP